MSDAFWGGMWVALPALFAAWLAYRKSESAEKKATSAEQILRRELANGNGVKFVTPEHLDFQARATTKLVQTLALLEARVKMCESKLDLDDTDETSRPSWD